MSGYYKNKFRIHSTRLRHWDYSNPGFYFVTICTKDNVCCFGDVKNNKVYFSVIGKIVFEELLRTPKLRSYVKLDDFIIMPNHVHFIVVIEDNDFDLKCRDTLRHVSTGRKFGYLPAKSLSSIINYFKGAVKRQCDKNYLEFQWQPNYYEHIIRSDKDYVRIKKYISHNPVNWEFDRNNHQKIF